jgi:ferritin-like metal-binding protein YciE
MSMSNLQELLKHELGDLLFAEKTILKALPKMAREVANPDMRARMEQHVRETEEQVTNLERAFEAIGERAKAEKCPGILGLVKEHDDFKKEERPSKPILEAFDLGSGLRVEHYEIAAYRTAIALARNLGIQQAIDALQQNLDQELAMAAFIESSAPMALEAARANSAAAASRGGSKRATKKVAAKRSGTKKAAAKKSTAKKSTAKKSAAKTAARRRSTR